MIKFPHTSVLLTGQKGRYCLRAMLCKVNQGEPWRRAFDRRKGQPLYKLSKKYLMTTRSEIFEMS